MKALMKEKTIYKPLRFLQVFSTALALTIVLYLIWLNWRLPILEAEQRYYKPTAQSAWYLCFVLGLGIALVFCLFVNNFKRLKVVLGFNVGRCIGTIILFLVFPWGTFG